jgi:transcriptional regulator with XRE-family HTH domain
VRIIYNDSMKEKDPNPLNDFHEELAQKSSNLENLEVGLVWITSNQAFTPKHSYDKEDFTEPADMDEKVALVQEKISYLIRRSGVSQEELAKKTGLQQSQISRWISSSSKGIPIYALLSLAEHLPIQWDKLFNFIDFPIVLPESVDRAIIDAIIIGEKENEKVAIHKKDLEGILLILGSDRNRARENSSLSLALGLAQQCQPLLLVEDGSGLSTKFLNEMEKKNPALLGQVIDLDFTTTSIPTNFFHVSSPAEIGPAFSLFRSILSQIENDLDPQALRAIEAGALALLDANLVLEKTSANIFDLRKFFQSFEFRQKIVNFSQNTASQEVFDIDIGSWERMSEKNHEELLAPFYRFLNILEGFSLNHSMLGATENLLPEALLENIILVRLPEEPAMAQVVFSLLQKELESSPDPRFCLFDNFDNYINKIEPLLEKRSLSLMLSSDHLSQSCLENIRSQAGICFHSLPGKKGLWSSEIQGEGDLLVEKKDGSSLSITTHPPLKVSSESPLYKLQLQEYHRNWLTRKPKKSLLRYSAEEVKTASREALERPTSNISQRQSEINDYFSLELDPEATEDIKQAIKEAGFGSRSEGDADGWE